MDYKAWCERWPEAAAELTAAILKPSDYSEPFHNASETDVSNYARLRESERGGRLFRNNTGAGTLQNGSFIRWGLANDSQRLNEHIKSADLIGIRPIEINDSHIGSTIGQFLSFEAKRPGWKFSGNAHEMAQLRWGQLIISLGGIAIMGTKFDET